MSKPVKEAPVPLKVVARYAGHYGGQHIREGQAFVLSAPGDFAASWMKPDGWDPKPLVQPDPQGDKTNTET